MIAKFGHAPLVQYVSKYIVEYDVGLGLGQLKGHEPLPVVEESQRVGVRRERAPPGLWTPSARKVLDRTVYSKQFMNLEMKEQNFLSSKLFLKHVWLEHDEI